MFITPELLESKQACGVGYEWFCKHYPEGVDLQEIVKIKHLNHHLLHWGYDNLDYTDEDLKLYFDVLKVINSHQVIKSDNITDSSYIQESSKVSLSQRIFYSTNIKNTFDACYCDMVEDSSQIFESNFVNNSNKVFKSNNIRNCINIINSTYVIESNNVFLSNNIVESNCIYKSHNLENCYFCSDCSDLTNCFMCQGIQNAEYMIFNQSVTKKQFEMLISQFKSTFQDLFLEYVNQWPEEFYTVILPTIKLNIIEYYSNLPDLYWKWLKTLPKYNEEIVYTITLNPDI